MNFETNSLFTCDALTLLERIPSEKITIVYLDLPQNNSSLSSQKNELNIEYEVYISKIIQQSCRILKNNGSLFVHWPFTASSDIRLVINQVFGTPPRYEITWPRRRIGNFGTQVDNEVFLIYTKTDSPIINTIFRPLTPEKESIYSMSDDRGKFKVNELTVAGNRLSMQFAWREYKLPLNRSWRFPMDKMENLAKDNRIYFPLSGSLPRLKYYLSDHPGIAIGTSWNDISSSMPMSEHEYRSQPPLAVMERIIKIASNEDDWILDPLCKLGTTVVAAQSLGRNWIGADSSQESCKMTADRLNKIGDLESNKNYCMFSNEEIMSIPVLEFNYNDVILNIKEISTLKRNIYENNLRISYLKDQEIHNKEEIDRLERENCEHDAVIFKKNEEINEANKKNIKLETENTDLKQKISNLIEGFALLKDQFDIDSDEENIEEVISQLNQRISQSISDQSVDSYINTVCSWLTLQRWNQLHSDSRKFLPQAEFLLDSIAIEQDYSPFILQYCRALENELLIKLFTAYTINFQSRHQNIDLFLSDDLNKTEKGEEKKTHLFAKILKQGENKYELGTMKRIMDLVKPDGKTFKTSNLLKDFYDFIIFYFDEKILEKTFLDQIEIINKDFRNKSAHPNVLNYETAQKCRDQVRKCLNELIMNYKGDK